MRLPDGCGWTFMAIVNTFDLTLGVNAAVANNIGGQIDGQIHFYKTPAAGFVPWRGSRGASPRPATEQRRWRHEARDIWNERPVVFAEFSITDRQAAFIDGVRRATARRAPSCCSWLSLRYADTGEPVFGSIDEICAQPFRARARLVRLADQAAAFVNGLQVKRSRRASRPPANGHDAAGGGRPFPLTPERVFLHRLALALHKTVG